ncbi:carboxypeptidase regulatory-like domain-containing protein [Parashewanella spongiae]|uniref:Carboxypeptidase regulatory-like domain-containing protein n=1 Tax=Parashewanella spongiae TaxID=342950 RepID=A0A3A6UJ45_9GAMM|nr:carboxypeptidase-like regulatory domain-containing protein [Parashewanella spongiae]MCL1077017.1 carboxypeptidase regulatory-like domain-containing protein [Parashewanella spongiae]RJY19121.1 carboxypeptidase regulatory-like domain-containing protein [Parashewanella spongiae]
MSALEKTKLLPLAIIISTVLSGCGGNDNDDNTIIPDTPINLPPVVTAANITTAENTEATLTAAASDTDGQIASYSWRKTAGPDITLSNTTSSTLTFTAPSVSEDTDAVFEVTVTDDDGATAVATATVSITDVAEPTPQVITVRGRVTDSPIPNARVSIVVGDDDPIEVPADAEGNYEFPLTYDASRNDDFVKITALGAEEGSNIRLISNVGSVQQIQQAADETTNVVTKDDLFTVNVTNVSTAVDALMKNANNGNEIDTLAEFEKSSLEYEPDMVMPLATAIKLVIDFSDDAQQPQTVGNRAPGLPEGSDDTADLVSDLSQVQAYILSALQSNSDEYDQANSAIEGDADLITSNVGNAATLTGNFYLKASDNMFEGDRLTLNSDNSGVLRNRTLDVSPVDITWAIDESGLVLTYGDNGVLSHDNTVVLPESSTEAFEVIRTSSLIRMMSSTGDSAQVSVQHTHVTRPENATDNTDATAVSTPSFGAQLLKESILKDPNEFFDTTDAEYTIPTPSGMTEDDIVNSGVPNYVDDQYKGSGRSIMKLNFNADSDASLTRYQLDNSNEFTTQTIPVTAQVNNDNHLEANVNGQPISFDFAFFSETSPLYINGMLTSPGEGEATRATPISSYLLKKEDDTAWSATNALGIYTLNWNMDTPNKHFWIELKDNGLAVTIKTEDANDNDQLENSEFSIEAGKWEIGSDGILTIRRYSQATIPEEPGNPQSCQPDAFTPSETGNCKIWHERKWDIQSIKGNQYFVVHNHQFHELSDTLPTAGTVTGNTVYSAIDNRKWTKVGTEDSARPVAIPAELLPPANNP